MRFGHFELLPAQRSLLVDGQATPLGARAFDMLLALIERRDRVVSGGELFDLVWPGLVVEENNLRQQIAALRKVLGAQALVTVPGRGYRFALPLEADEAPRPAPAPVNAPNNLPLNPSPLIGRETELSRVLTLLADTHLLTLVGTGGVGKTRFALELADRLRDAYKDGVWLVELAPLTDPALVVRTVASVLDVHEEPGRPLLDTLLDLLRRRELLIVLDNCEHLIDACAQFADKVLHGSAGVRTLATSREALGIVGETVWRVPSLRAATPADHASADQLLVYAATRLFVQRAAAASPGFRLTPENATAVAQICHQLDGIPLALELAAARVKAMRVELVAERLRDRFALLTQGSRTALQRHQTLRSLIDWSHDLLPEPEQRLLRRLSVFAGGWTLEGAEGVCSDSEHLAADDVLDLLTHLVEKSLVALDEQSSEPRYRMLETIRQYGFEKLTTAGEADGLRSRHLAYFGDFAESLRTALVDGDLEPRWNARANAELDNVRVALDWSLVPGQAERGLHLVNALHRYWYQNMHWKEIVGRIERLGMCGAQQGPPTVARARSLYVAAMLATNFDPPLGRHLSQACLSLSRSLDFAEGEAWALMWIGYIDTRQRDPDTAALFTESVRLGHRIEDPWRQAMLLIQCLVVYAGYEALMGHDQKVEELIRDCEAEIRKIGDSGLYHGHCRALQGTVATRRGEFERASELLTESLALYRAVESKFEIAGSLAQQGFLALQQNDPRRALQLFRESLPVHRNFPRSPWVTKGLAHLLIAYAACEQWQATARLVGVLGEAVPTEVSGRVGRAYADSIARARAALGESGFRTESALGAGMSREQAIEFALAP
ncbi:hypothetical protein BH11PSE10_BH11PSE10_03710 [soil metagenome]